MVAYHADRERSGIRGECQPEANASALGDSVVSTAVSSAGAVASSRGVSEGLPNGRE
jgi:hypothetical protein